MSKGSTQRPVDKDKFDKEFERIFRKGKEKRDRVRPPRTK